MPDPNSMLVWLPKLVGLHIPFPKTIFVTISRENILKAMDGEEPLNPQMLALARNAASQLGYPVFLRTDLCSAKHGWKDTCYVPDEGSLVKHIWDVCEFNECADLMGLDYSALAFREFLDLEAPFTAFYGKMPINRERRYFVKDGKVVCHHPYWPADAIEEHNPSHFNWRALLDKLNEEPDEEVEKLSAYAIQANIVLPGYWSVDFAKTKSGEWHLIDMARGAESFHWEGCEKAG